MSAGKIFLRESDRGSGFLQPAMFEGEGGRGPGSGVCEISCLRRVLMGLLEGDLFNSSRNQQSASTFRSQGAATPKLRSKFCQGVPPQKPRPSKFEGELLL